MKYIASALLLCLTLPTLAAEPTGLARLDWILGDWKGEGHGDPGDSSSERHAQKILNGKFVQVAGRSVYEKQEKNPKGEIHEQTDVWSYDRSRKTLTLRQFDSLGFATTYVLDAAVSDSGRWVLNGEVLENVPRGWKARYIYTLTSASQYEETLELDTDGKGFKPYVTNVFRKQP